MIRLLPSASVALLASSGVLLGAVVAEAQPSSSETSAVAAGCTDEAEAEAAAQFEEARQLAATRELVAAQATYERSLSRCPRIPTAFNLARILEQRGDKIGARDLFDALLEGAYGALDAPVIGVVSEARAQATDAIAELTLRALGADPVDLMVDGAEVATVREAQEATIEVNPGRRIVQAIGPAGQRVERAVEIDLGATIAVELELPLSDSRGRLVVSAEDPRASVAILGVGEAVGTLSRQLPPDLYTVQLGDGLATESVEVTTGNTVRVELSEQEFYESPWVWVAVGAAVVAGGLAAAIVFAAQSGDPMPEVDPIWGRVEL